MRAEEIFREVLKAPELQTIFMIPEGELIKESMQDKSDYYVIEIIKEIIRGVESHKSKEQIFQITQKQIMQL